MLGMSHLFAYVGWLCKNVQAAQRLYISRL